MRQKPLDRTKQNPFDALYRELRWAFDHFNTKLFDEKLPPCVITVQRKQGAHGYFSPDRWQQRTKRKRKNRSDEIALNPIHFDGRTDRDILSTLVHEMVHLKQKHFGKPGRKRYHNKQWTAMMVEVGLQPSTTGTPGGKQTGERVSHYVIEKGRYAAAYLALKKDGFSLSWDEIPVMKEKGPASNTRIKYTCPDCELNAWAKPKVQLICGDCETEMRAP